MGNCVNEQTITDYIYGKFIGTQREKEIKNHILSCELCEALHWKILHTHYPKSRKVARQSWLDIIHGRKK